MMPKLFSILISGSLLFGSSSLLGGFDLKRAGGIHEFKDHKGKEIGQVSGASFLNNAFYTVRRQGDRAEINKYVVKKDDGEYYLENDGSWEFRDFEDPEGITNDGENFYIINEKGDYGHLLGRVDKDDLDEKDILGEDFFVVSSFDEDGDDNQGPEGITFCDDRLYIGFAVKEGEKKYIDTKKDLDDLDWGDRPDLEDDRELGIKVNEDFRIKKAKINFKDMSCFKDKPIVLTSDKDITRVDGDEITGLPSGSISGNLENLAVGKARVNGDSVNLMLVGTEKKYQLFKIKG